MSPPSVASPACTCLQCHRIVVTFFGSYVALHSKSVFFMPVTAFSYKHSGYEPKDKLSLTVPGQVLSLKQIQDRFRRGQSVNVKTYAPVYNPDFPPGDENLNVFDRMDKAREAAVEVARQKRVLEQQEKSRKQDAEDKRIDKLVQEKVQSITTKTDDKSVS